MRKMKTLFVINREKNQAIDEIVDESSWVFDGEGIPSEKFDGTSCLFEAGKLWRRYDRKLHKRYAYQFRKGEIERLTLEMFKPAPIGFVACESRPDPKTGHWPGWIPVNKSNPADKHHIDALNNTKLLEEGQTYELVGPKIQGNLYDLTEHQLWQHGSKVLNLPEQLSYQSLKKWLSTQWIEGIVWHHPDGRMVKLRRKDFGFSWGNEQARR